MSLAENEPACGQLVSQVLRVEASQLHSSIRETSRLTTSVQREMRLNETARRERGHERKLSRQDGGADDAGETLCVLSRADHVRALDAEEVQH